MKTRNPTVSDIASGYLRAYGFRKAYGVAQVQGEDRAVLLRICSMVRTWRNEGRKAW